jgi:signal transduction histidine kinase
MRMKVSSIRIKFAIIAMLISFISFGVAAFFSTKWLVEEIEIDYKEKAALIGTHILHDIGTTMVSHTRRGISDVLDIYQNYKDVEEVRVFNRKGDEIFSKVTGPPEARVKEALRTGESIFFNKEINKKEVTSYIIPIVNKPECHGCHAKSEDLRGALLLSLNQEQMKGYVGQQRQRFFILLGLIAITVGVATITAISRLFLKPLSLIQKGTEAIKEGNFEYQIPVSSKDEIGILTENFNHMAETLQSKTEELWKQLGFISRSQKEWQETFDSITDLIAVIDSGFNIIRANRAFYEYNSISPATEIDKKCYELLGTCIRPSCPHVLSIGNKKYINKEIRDEKTGKVLEVSYFPYYSAERNFLGTIFIAKDVTERKETEVRLIMNERLAALGQMASGIAHEINNPLATIATCTEGLLNRLEKEKVSPIFGTYLRIIDEEVFRCKGITTDMLSFVRKANHERKEVNLNEVLNKTLEMISLQGRLKEVEILRNLHGEGPTVLGNEGELIQAFTSVIINALDAMEDHGTLSFEMGTEGDRVFIKISDTGCGIPPGLTHRIFDPFFTTKSERGGTGLGLAIAKKIIEENNGKIEVASEEGKGTSFTITLPI